MTREMILRNRLEMASHNLYCLSSNYLLTIPKEGKEREHKEAAAEVEMLKTWLKEFHSTNMESTREFVGYIDGWSNGFSTYDGQPIAEKIQFQVDTGADYPYGDERTFVYISVGVRDWFMGKNGGCGRYDLIEDCRRPIKITVDINERVRSIEWVTE